MIVGMGVDIVDLERVKRIYARYGQNFARKILTAREMAYLSRRSAIPFLGGRFAAKEAVVKALGSGFAGGIAAGQIEILPDSLGAPRLELFARALERARLAGAASWHVSISHERNCAVALAIFEDKK